MLVFSPSPVGGIFRRQMPRKLRSRPPRASLAYPMQFGERFRQSRFASLLTSRFALLGSEPENNQIRAKAPAGKSPPAVPNARKCKAPRTHSGPERQAAHER